MSVNRRDYEKERDDFSRDFRSSRVEKDKRGNESQSRTYRDSREEGRRREGRLRRERSPERIRDRYVRSRDSYRGDDEDVRSRDRERTYRRDRYSYEEKRREDRSENEYGGNWGRDRRPEQERSIRREREMRMRSPGSPTGDQQQQKERHLISPEESQKKKGKQDMNHSSENYSEDQPSPPASEMRAGETKTDKDNKDEIFIEQDPMADMQSMMGFSGFGTTTGKKHGDVGQVFKQKKAKYRQYMNRPGGFNRPLERD
ncbi:U4/U6 X U5 tri-snRNP complex subunit [Schizosaccharomyces cryophilus OY26]|uniref:U4/U6 X U5 tri-snRNP complex subunit n=1 Tax=Schizosaccharomyces cryophilus (strain OY26 / ATCC MYA-4695 / CBS 11777 / NBRC 106824 / NRRL Y48691) TaxID=653667 RepID=S9VUA6_SCHCR|nr:U4/U6 X U5 tri-snRNP complex subunit [Schizosaccharomyces cryophilus OY26]EPY51353.1 U4/U6 X U5 tri-snRNP complex subunit [Schizosaccharomyces cryophilus OY26]